MNFKRRDFLKIGLVQTLATQLSSVSRAEKVEPNIFRKVGPSILQGATDSQRTQFSIVHNVTQAYQIVAVDSKKNVFEADLITTKKFGNHVKVITKAFFSGLDPDEIYSLQLIDKVTSTLIDQREFKTLNLDKTDLKFAICSCMHDSRHDPKLWTDLFSKNPDVIFFIGDTVYADAVKEVKKAADPEQLWNRFSEARSILEAYFSPKLIPIFATWDDHDFGLNDANGSFPYVKESQENFLSFFAQDEEYCSLLEKGPGVSSAVNIAGQLFLLLDDRSFRKPSGSKERYAHWGQTQEEWMMNLIKDTSGPTWIMNGSQFFPAVFFKESVSRDHKVQFKGFLETLKALNKKVIFASGDVHYSEITRVDAEVLGFETFEITSSGFHSAHIPGAPDIIPNSGRIASTGKANYILVQSEATEKGLYINLECCSAVGKINFTNSLKV